MKKRFLLTSVCVLLLGAAAFGQNNSITFQPYLSFDWDPLFFDPVIGDHYGNYRAFNFDQAGLKVTGKLDKVTAYIEVRGFPSGTRDSYNKYDGGTPLMNAGWEKPVYYAWGKYQFTETGNIWAGNFKPAFGPILFDWSHIGIGWQQKIAGAHTVSAFLLQPRDANGYFNAQSPMSAGSSKPEQDNEGVRLLLLEEFMSQTMMLSGGVLFDHLPQDAKEDATKVYLNVFAAYWGIPNLTLSGEFGVAIYSQKDGIKKDTKPEDSGAGLGVYIAGEYKIIDTLSAGISFKFIDPLMGAKKVNLGAGQVIDAATYQGTYFQSVDGEVSTAALGIYAKYAPARGFYIQPGVSINLANALNDYQPVKHNGDDGSKVGASFNVLFRWEPSLNIKF